MPIRDRRTPMPIRDREEEKKPRRRDPVTCFKCDRCGFSSTVKKFYRRAANSYGDPITVCISRSCQ